MEDLNSLNPKINKKVLIRLEQQLGKYLKYTHVIAVESEEVAFKMSFEALDLTGEVFCSPLAPLSLHRSLSLLKLRPRYLDVTLDARIETRFLERQLTDESSCLVISHYHGILSDAGYFQQFCQGKDLILIEDATQSFSPGLKSGAEIVVFSLEGLLPRGIAKGAFIATDNTLLAEQLRVKVAGGYEKRKNWNYELLTHEENVQLSGLTAHFSLENLSAIDLHNETIRKIQKNYIMGLADSKMLSLPSIEHLSVSTFFPVILAPALFCPKEDIYRELLEAGVSVEVGLKPVYKTVAFLDESLQMFGAEEVYKGILLLPIDSAMSEDAVLNVVKILKKILNKYEYRGCSF